MTALNGKPRGLRRALMMVMGVLASIITFAIGADVALAHHADLTASVDCTRIVSYTASSWTTGSSGRNPDIDIYVNYSGLANPVKIQDGSFANNLPGSPNTADRFSGTYAWPASNPASITVSVRVVGTWGSGDTSKTGDSVTVNRPGTCTPQEPVLSLTCTSATAGTVKAFFEVTGSGSGSIPYYVTDATSPLPTPSGDRSFSLSAGGSKTLTFSNVANNTNWTLTYTRSGTTMTKSIAVDCAPKPVATFQTKCVNALGSVEVSLTNAGKWAISLDVFVDGAKVETVNVPAGTTTAIVKNFGSLANNTSHSIVVKKANGDVVGQTTYSPACAPGNPAVGFTPVCANALGSVGISFTNSGNSAISLDVFVDGVKVDTVNVPALTASGLSKSYGSLANNTSHSIQVKKANGDIVGQTTYSPACAPGNPAVGFTPECSNALGSVTVSFTNSGNSAISLDVFVDGAKVDTVNVPALTASGLSKSYGSLANNTSHSIQVKKANGDIVGQTTYSPACAPGNPAVGFTPECSNALGSVTVSFTNSGNSAISLDVFVDGAKVDTVNVPALTASGLTKSYGSLANNTPHSIQVKKANGDIVGETTYSPQCAPAAPAVTFDPVCSNALGSVTISFTNPGNAAATLTVLIDGNAQSPTVVVPALTTVAVTATYSDLANNVDHTIEVRNGATSVGSTTYNPSCAPGKGTPTIAYVCSGFDGTVTITLAKTGGDLPVVFVLDGTTYTLNNGDAPVVVTYNNVPDGPFTKTVTVNGEPTELTVDVHCDAVLTGVPVCNEVDVNNVVTTYGYIVTNPGATGVPITWTDGAGTVPAGGTLLVKSNTTPLVASNGQVTAVTVAASTERCGKKVTFEKKLLGQPVTGETYTIRVSRLVGAEYTEYLTFPLEAGIIKEITLPSTIDGAGVTYKIEETNAGTASLHTVSPDTFSLQGNLGETVSVVVTNGYAAVVIDKTVSATSVKGGDTLTYTLIAQNTGGLTLDPVVISDQLPPNLSMSSALVANGQGTCVLARETRPQLISCDIAGSLAPGGFTPMITIQAQVDLDTQVGATILNQAKVLGTYIGAPDPVSGETYTAATRDAEIVRLRTQAEGDELSCLPVVDGTVCDLSAKVGSLVEANSDSLPPVTVPPTVVPEPPVLTTPPISQLPVTGSSGISGMLGFGLAMLGLGGIAIVARRRRSSSTSV